MQSHGAWLRSPHAQQSEHRSGVEHRHIHAQHEQRAHSQANRCRQIDSTVLRAIQDAQQRIATEGYQ